MTRVVTRIVTGYGTKNIFDIRFSALAIGQQALEAPVCTSKKGSFRSAKATVIKMIIGIKDALKLFGISVIACCAVLVCAMFFNFYLDLTEISDQIPAGQAQIFYDAQISTAGVVCLVTGGCLLATSVVMLFFYIKHYIDMHKKELGILKALGYSDIRIARSFALFGASVLGGTGAGFGGAWLLMPFFYSLQNKDGILPEIPMQFHLSVVLYFVLLPTAVFSLLAVGYACLKLKEPVLNLLKDRQSTPFRRRMTKKKGENCGPFLSDLQKSTLSSKKTLVFLIAFSSFCFSAMTQMSFSMKDLSSEMMGAMILIIGLILAFVTLFLAVTTVVSGNRKTIAMMRAFGYSEKECSRAVLGCYRPVAAAGFALGSVYQYLLLRLMVDLVFKDFPEMPEYTFDFPVMLLSLAVFTVAYETVMACCTAKLGKTSVKEIMSE